MSDLAPLCQIEERHERFSAGLQSGITALTPAWTQSGITALIPAWTHGHTLHLVTEKSTHYM